MIPLSHYYYLQQKDVWFTLEVSPSPEKSISEVDVRVRDLSSVSFLKGESCQEKTVQAHHGFFWMLSGIEV